MIDFEPNYIVGCAGTIATFFALLGNFWCKYTSFLFQVTSKLTDATGEYTLYYGVWNYRDTAVSYTELDGSWYITQYFFCRAYGEGIDMDATWKAAMAFTILAVLIGGMASCVSCCANMEVEQCQNINMAMPLAIAFLFATLFQGLSFLFFKVRLHWHIAQAENDLSLSIMAALPYTPLHYVYLIALFLFSACYVRRVTPVIQFHH
jgi:hypothetical protein